MNSKNSRLVEKIRLVLNQDFNKACTERSECIYKMSRIIKNLPKIVNQTKKAKSLTSTAWATPYEEIKE
jgi:hypothetical protein